jgi:AcrR family transcriptional regulator
MNETTPKSANRSQEILARATELFATHGFAGTSIRRIARGCGITEAAIYRHYDSKLHLYEEVIRAKAAQHDIGGYLRSKAGQGTIVDALIAVSSHIMRLTREDPALVRLMFNNTLESGNAPTVLFQEIRMPYVDFLTREFEARIAAGEIRPVTAFLTARCYVGMVLDCALNLGTWNLLYPSQTEPAEIYTNSATIFANGLTINHGGAADGLPPQPGRTS